MSPADGRRGLYPEIEPYDSGLLKVSALHTLYFEQCGNPRVAPAATPCAVHKDEGYGHQKSLAMPLRSQSP